MDKNKKLISIVIALFVVVIIMLSGLLYFVVTKINNNNSNAEIQNNTYDSKYLVNVSLKDVIRTNLLKD